MNENSKPKISKINHWLRDAAEQLANVGITSALLDAEIILAHTLRRSRTWLHAHSDDELSARDREIANARLDLRLDRTPIAYIIGHKEFYSRLFKVTPSVLVPRPESEAIITLLRNLVTPDMRTLVDIGTGSGCLGITAKCELPDLSVTLTDISRHALLVAQENATALHADVSLIQSNLFSNIPGTFDIIIANLPYVDVVWERSPETIHEPDAALYADDAGLAIIKRFITQLPAKLSSGGLCFIEADPRQHVAIITEANTYGLAHETTEGFIVVLRAPTKPLDTPTASL